MEKREVWVDYAKAIGIILVVYGHVSRGLFNAGIPMNTEQFKLIDSIVYSFHMPLFFFLSGLFFYRSLQKRKSVGLVVSKLNTIIYPYILWSIVQGVIEVIFSSQIGGTTTYSEVFALLWRPRAQFWFLYALFAIFLISAVIFRAFSIKKLPFVLLAAGGLFVFQPLYDPGYVLSLITNNLIFFILGISFRLWINTQILVSNLVLGISAAAFGVGQYVFHVIFGQTYLDKGLPLLLLSAVSIFFVITLSQKLAKLPNNLLLVVGSSSMGIYMLHILAGSGIRVLLKNFLGVDSFWLHLLAGCLVGIFGPLIVVRLVDRMEIPFVFSAPNRRLTLRNGNSLEKKT